MFSQDEIALSIFDSALNKIESEDITGAMYDFDLALKKTSNDSIRSEIFFERAQLKRRNRYNIKDYYGALEDYTKAIELYPNNFNAYMYRGLLYNRNFQNYKLHRADVLKSLEINPLCGACWTEMGFGYNSFTPDESKNALMKALEIGVDLDMDGINDADYYLYGALADFALEDGDINGSINYNKLLIENFEPIDSDGDGEIDDLNYVEKAYYGIAMTYFFYLNDIENAISNLDKAIEINPNNVDFFTLRSKIKYSNNDIEGALKDYEQAKATTNQVFYNDVLISKNFYPYKDFDRDLDSISLPVILDLNINLKEILGLDTSNEEFFMSLDYNVFSTEFPLFINHKGDTIDLFDFEDVISPKFVKSPRLNRIGPIYNGRDDIDITSKVRYLGSISSDFFHNWNLQDYPFDTQNLKFSILLEADTSFVRLKESDFFKSSFKEINQLKEGYNIEAINFEETFIAQQDEETFFPGTIRSTVYPQANFNILVSRAGGWLFLKLFLGSFLAFVMSVSAFTVRKENFGTRIDITVGALFIAVGNKYFVESITPMVQVLTKADIINNISLLIIILNVIFIIGQHRDDLKIGIFEDSKFTLKFSSVLLALLIFITIIS